MSPFTSLTVSSALRLIASGCICASIYFIWKLYQARLFFYRLKKRGMPMPPWSPIFGHLTVLPPILKNLPRDATQFYLFQELAKNFPQSDSLYYIDLWPFSDPMIIVATPEIAYQACQELDLPKPSSLLQFFMPITGGNSLAAMNGEEHRMSRALFNPGFAHNVVLENTKKIVEEASVYVEILRRHALKGDIFSLDEVTCNYMMDVIGRVALDAKLSSQTSDNPLCSAMRGVINRQVREEELNPFIRYNPLIPLMDWWDGHTMDRYIAKELGTRFEEWKCSKVSDKARSVIDLALEDYMKTRKPTEELDRGFTKWACAQIRLFLFVGHDSTAAAIVYSLYLLSKHPEAMARVRKEHDDVFGKDVDKARDLLIERPQLTNELSYTTAVIKETLRLFPPAAAIRDGLPGAFLRNPKSSDTYPTDGCAVLVPHTVLHRNERYWYKASEFLPERWLVGPKDPLYPPRWGWRPLEFGSRNCLGQNLVMLDLKVTLVMIIREFDVRDAYAEWDSQHAKIGPKMVQGERSYQISRGSAHPADGFPCLVTARKSL